jgi:integrase
MPPRRPKGEGSIYQRKDGRWVGMLDLGWRDGRRRRKAVYGRTQREAVRNLNAVKRELAEHGDIPTGALTVEAWLRQWLDGNAADRVGETTLPGYRSKMELYVIPAIGRVRMDKLSPEHLDRMYAAMRKAGRADATVPQTHRILSRALKVAHRYNKVSRNVAALIDAPPVPTTEVDGLSPTEVTAVLETIAGQEWESRWLAAVVLGMRQGECLGLGWEHVDLDAGTITVERALARVTGQGLKMKPPKSRKSARTFPVPDFVLDSLRRHKDTQPPSPLGLVWPNDKGEPMDPRRDWAAWKALLTRAQVADYRLHDARHSAATTLVMLGVPLPVVMKILGHSQIAMTARYSHADIEAMRSAMALVEAAHRPALGSGT